MSVNVNNNNGPRWVMTPEEQAIALQEAKARGLPDGWRVELDKRKRRKWIAPNNRSCDSIPKAMAISVELGMLPKDTVLQPGPPKTKRGRPPVSKRKPGKKLKRKKAGRKAGRKPRIALDLTQPGGDDAAAMKLLTGDSDDSDDDDDSDDSDDDELDDTDDDNDDEEEGLDAPPRKKPALAATTSAATKFNNTIQRPRAQPEQDELNDSEEEDEEDEMEPPTEPETTLEPGNSHLTTVHWDPAGPAAQKIGCRIRVSDDKTGDWKEGRIIRYDPCTHKHKIKFFDKTRSIDKVDQDNCCWLHLRMEEGVQISTRLVWAHVKGYAWWPAMVMESDVHNVRDGYVNVEFFGSLEVATLRDNPECVRTFENGKIDNVIQKNKKKRNMNAVALAIEEEQEIQNARNAAAKFYATKAWEMANAQGDNLLGTRIQIWRDDVNYPYGDTVAGRVRQYSAAQKKWLVSYEVSEKVRKKYEASWINLQAKEHKLRILEKQSKGGLTNFDLLPFLKGFKIVGEKDSEPEESTDTHLDDLREKCCSGCVDYWKKNESKITCSECNGSYHFGCLDPPMSKEAYQRIIYDQDSTFVCCKCQTCRGCYQKDVAFGSHIRSVPKTLTFPEGEDLILCSMCTKYFEEEQYCPNCAHTWDDLHFQHVQRQIRWQQEHRPKRRGRKRKKDLADPTSSPDFHSFTAPATIEHEDPFPKVAKVNPAWFHPETSQWGYTEVDMLTCDSCSLWVHAGCAGVDEDEYDLTSSGEHPIYSKEFLCRVCCRQRCLDLIYKMQQEDKQFLFAEPVTDKVAPNYLDVVKRPMDLQTMLIKAERDEYKNYAWVRELFELMVLNALTFNRFHTNFWNEAKRFHKACLVNVFGSFGKGAPPSKYEVEILANYEKANEAKKMEEERVREDITVEKKDLVAGSNVVTVDLPELREKPPDHPSCLPCHEAKLKPKDAYYCGWMECCFTCGSSGASDTFLFCVDCGEAFHAFCVNAPIHSMDNSAVASWRCPNCKICEISGDAPQDELKMLFCEMCDRGFSLDLLDPPLLSAPPGVWICGQCVDCHKCNNSLEPNGPSLKHWSRDPHLCYRCGGCDGLVELYAKDRKCPLCNGIWRDEDTDLAECVDCRAKVHSRCDSRASAFVKKIESGKTDESGEGSGYHCPGCSRKQGVSKDDGKVTRGHMADFAWKVISSGILDPGDIFSKQELQEKVMEQIDWKTRNLWRDEYRKVVLEGVRFMNLAREQFGDPRYLMDRFWHENEDLPAWMGQRATRFLHIANKLKLDSLGFSARRIENCVMISKLAASWLKVACRMMGIKTKKNVKGYERVMKLLVAPHESGSVDLAFDSIRCERNRNIINKDDWMKIYEPRLKPYVQYAVFSAAPPEATHHVGGELRHSAERGGCYKLAQPLCGWNKFLEVGDMTHKWNDPRECCLCHLCGDDDAGLPDETPNHTSDRTKPAIARLGRLLPMGEGLWVHTACALWSSETWEASSGGLVNSLEKARSRGAQLRCFGCSRPGATVGCVKQNCNCNYHFPCAFACGAVFNSSKQMWCSAHKESAEDVVQNPSSELMKTLIVAKEKAKPTAERDAEAGDGSFCPRTGSLLVHCLGEIEQNRDGFHTENHIMPPGYTATRIFWSAVTPKERTVYVLKIEKSSGGRPLFTITPADNPGGKIKASSAENAYDILMDQVCETNAEHFSHGDLFSKLPTERKSRKKVYGMNGPQFFGFGTNCIRQLLEALPGSEALVTKLTDSSPQYLFCYVQPSEDAIMDLQRRRAAIEAEKKLENATGCARTEGMTAVTRSGGSDRITRALVRKAENEDTADPLGNRKPDAEKVKADRSRMQRLYREMRIVPIEQRLVPKRSHIHGWGLFTKIDLPKDAMIVEYMGETIRQSVADQREKAYEVSGEGSCYMFRLDMHRIVDATKIGCMARFMNHCCQPNAYAKIISVDTETGPEKKIMIFALNDIKAGEEITYDYKFQVEDGSLKCTCGAPNCIGRMN
ncbi:glutamine amidotransferases class-II [Nitzschia inconspicua]|uniref:Glutamine amidotransferases class-II n=1 Tax=Nitzschia inconspicua TaxID=303405 RepID=A0A9K3KN69_9STRA|nr:glutamine amidotransferases class-II [Nitzschia inconspicua]